MSRMQEAERVLREDGGWLSAGEVGRRMDLGGERFPPARVALEALERLAEEGRAERRGSRSDGTVQWRAVRCPPE